MITEYLREEQISHVIDRVIVAKHDVREEGFGEIVDSNGNHVRVFRLVGRGATGEVESMPYGMLRKLRARRPVPTDKGRHPDAGEMATIRARAHITEEDEKFIFLGTSDPSTAKFYNELGTLIATINIFDEIKIIVELAGGSMPDKKGEITFDHLMDSFERPVRNPFMK